VVDAVKEAALATVVFTPEAEKRLGLSLVPVERKTVPRIVSNPGDVMIPPGRLISVTSPFPATLKSPPNALVPVPGAKVDRGQAIFLVEPNITPGERATMTSALVDIEGQVKAAEEQLKIAKTDMDRKENLVRDRVLPATALVDSKALYDVAQTNLRAVKERRGVIEKMIASGLTAVPAASPVKGVLQNLHAQVDQQVPAGAVLFDVAEMDPIWVKVGVYVGDVEQVAHDRPAGVGSLADPPGISSRVAQPVSAPGAGDPIAATVFLYYQVDNHDHALRPGQRVGVTLPLRGEEASLVVPRSTLIRDIHGGTWVYVQTAPHSFARKRVQVDRVVGDLVALVSGPKVGDKVVAEGAAEIFGTEFPGK
jgi:RND family efflux transporter MFP subunit